jgi:hypothetical protein
MDDLIKKFKCRTDGTMRNRRDSYIKEDQKEKVIFQSTAWMRNRIRS